MVEGVVITGGEPTIQKDLIPFMLKIKELGYLVKLDTNGYLPNVLKNCCESGACDYVAMDIKTSLDSYNLLTGVNVDISRIEESISYLMSNKVDYEFRTTVVKELHNRENFEKIGKLIRGCKRYFLQSFIPSEDTIKTGFSSPDPIDLKNYVNQLKCYIENVSIRDMA